MSQASLLAIDWGSTNLRAWALDNRGAVLGEQRRPAGIIALGREAARYAATLNEITEALSLPSGTPALLSGMVGARQGWKEAPYCELPCGAGDLARHVAVIPDHPQVRIVPGVCQRAASAGTPDVMRGEETEVLGLASLSKTAGEEWFVLPGTHTKWLRVAGGRIRSFRSFPSGELRGLVLQHGLLGAMMDGESPTAKEDLLAGHALARAAGGPLGPLFSLRAAGLIEGLSPAAGHGRLVGLLIGQEIAEAAHLLDGQRRVTLVGEGAQVEAYALLLDAAGLEVVRRRERAALRGLIAIARAIGLLHSPSPLDRERGEEE